jgi:cyanuric acid amidohydrolase
MRHPGDVSGVEALFDAGLPPGQVVAILGKTEGNGCVNDFTRAYAVQALNHMLARRGGRPDVAMVMSGGTEGGLSPHFLVFAVGEGPAAAGGRLAMGAAFTREFLPEEMGRMAQVEATAAAVRAAIAEAGIAEVHYVQVKCPLLTSERIADALARGQNVATHDTYHSMGLSRGASALGVALALGEVASVTDADIGVDTDKFSGVASASAGVELLCNEILVLGNSPHWGGDLRISHAVMRDGIDFPAVQAALRDAGFAAQGQLSPEDEARVLAVLAKAEPSTTGRIRGARHIMNDDSDINATRHARALVGGVIAAAVGRTELFVSGGAEHQGPDGGGPVAVIASVLG